jgi:phage host-nuclease inhibitor protein Gam
MKILDYLVNHNFDYDEYPDHLRKCPMCGQFLKYISKSKTRKIITLKGSLETTLKKFRCTNKKCVINGNMYDPLSIAMPNIKVGKDVLKELLILKFHKRYNTPKIRQELKQRYHIQLGESTIKRYMGKGETLYLSNIRALIPRIIGHNQPIIINMDYIEPKAKRHKIFIAFEHNTSFPILYKILDSTNEANIQALIKKQIPEIKDLQKIYVSDADTSLLYTNLEENTQTKHHMCLMHFRNICYKIAKPLDDASFTLLDNAISKIWKPIKKEKDEKNQKINQFDGPELHDTFGFKTLNTINAITEIKEAKGKEYKSQRVLRFVQAFIKQMAELDANKVGLDMTCITDTIHEVKRHLSENSEYFITLEKFSHDIDEICSIIKDKSLNSQKTKKALLSFAKRLHPPSVSLNRIEGRQKRGRKKKKAVTVERIWNDLKERVEKYASWLSTLKDYECEDLTNNRCESRFSALRCFLRQLMGFKDHSSHEYLNALYFFHLMADVPCKLNLQQLSCYHINRFKSHYELYKEGCFYYNRFHNKPGFISTMLRELNVFTSA